MVKPNPPAVVVWVGAAGAAGAAVNPNPVVAVVWAVETAPSPKPPGTGCAGTAPKLKPEGATVWAVVPEGSEKPAVVAVQAEVAGAVALVACMLPKEKPAAGGAVALPKPPKLPLFIARGNPPAVVVAADCAGKHPAVVVAAGCTGKPPAVAVAAGCTGRPKPVVAVGVVNENMLAFGAEVVAGAAAAGCCAVPKPKPP